MTEDQFQRALVDLCKWLGLLVYHNPDSRRSTAGFPDLVICGPKGTIFAELKSKTGRVRPEQKVWLERLRAGGQRAFLWRPTDFDEARRILQEIAGR